MIEVIHGDALDFEPGEGVRFQALISDLPYSDHVHANITSAGTMGEGSRGWHRQELTFGSLTPALLAHVAAFVARVHGWSLLYSDIESAHLIRAACEEARAEYVRGELAFLDDPEDAPAGYSGVVPWERWSQPQKSGDRPTQGAELVSIFWGRAHQRKAWNGPGSLTAFHHKSLRGAEKHRTEKPLDQALDMVSWFSNGPGLPWGPHDRAFPDRAGAERIPPAEVMGRLMTAEPTQNAEKPVLDLCLGSGTVAVACALLDRGCVGFELDEEWAGKADQRAQAALRGVLTDRDRDRAERWVESAVAEAEGVPFPRAPDGSDVKTWERAQRRLADAYRVGDKL